MRRSSIERIICANKTGECVFWHQGEARKVGEAHEPASYANVRVCVEYSLLLSSSFWLGKLHLAVPKSRQHKLLCRAKRKLTQINCTHS